MPPHTSHRPDILKLSTFTRDFLSEGWVLCAENERVFLDGKQVVVEPFGKKERNAWQRRKNTRITDQKRVQIHCLVCA